MGIGKSKQIKLVQITPTKGTEGNWSTETETNFNTWAEITDANSFRDYANGQTNIGETKKFKVRFRFDQYPGADWKIQYAGKDWTVTGITREDERKFYWIMTATVK